MAICLLTVQKAWCLYHLGFQGKAWVDRGVWNGMVGEQSSLRQERVYPLHPWCFGCCLWASNVSGVWQVQLRTLSSKCWYVTPLFHLKFALLLAVWPGQTKGKVRCQGCQRHCRALSTLSCALAAAGDVEWGLEGCGSYSRQCDAKVWFVPCVGVQHQSWNVGEVFRWGSAVHFCDASAFCLSAWLFQDNSSIPLLQANSSTSPVCPACFSQWFMSVAWHVLQANPSTMVTWVKSLVQWRLLAVEQRHPAVLSQHCSKGGAGTLQTPATRSCIGTGKTQSFYFRDEVKNRAQGHLSFYSQNSIFCYWLLLCSATR